MANSVLVVFCPICRGEEGAYDPSRTMLSDLGAAVRRAASSKMAVEFRPSPVKLHLTGCVCGKPSSADEQGERVATPHQRES